MWSEDSKVRLYTVILLPVPPIRTPSREVFSLPCPLLTLHRQRHQPSLAHCHLSKPTEPRSCLPSQTHCSMFSGTPSVSGGGWSRASRKSSSGAPPPSQSAHSTHSGGRNNQVTRFLPSACGSSRSGADYGQHKNFSFDRGEFADPSIVEDKAQQERIRAKLLARGYTEFKTLDALMKATGGGRDGLVQVEAKTSDAYDRKGNPVQLNSLDGASQSTPAQEFAEIMDTVAKAAFPGNKAPRPRRQSTSTASGWEYPSSSAGSRPTSFGGPPRLQSIQEYRGYTPSAPSSRGVQSRQSGQSRQRAPSVQSGQSAPSERSTRSVQSGITNRTLRPKDSISVASDRPRHPGPPRYAPNVSGSSRDYAPTAEQIYRHNKKSDRGRR